ncbi:uncharacterized protein [Lepeophtheirus salmonis]|uniref:uncharacterized protein n=1 Tax=Lepeophtheirus salmonis TaxID=72036 RepID=UPI001AE3DFD8|nr:uncharacterized protein LOC121131425 [Lepeophtheirus salmonis]
MKESSSDEDFDYLNEKDVMKPPLTISEDSIKSSMPSSSTVLEEEQQQIKHNSAPVINEKILRAVTSKRNVTSPKPPTSPKPSRIPRVNNNNSDITKIYTEALSNGTENNNKNSKVAAVVNRSKPYRDITEIYKNTILAKEATPPQSLRNKPTKAITSLYTDKIDKPISPYPSEKLKCPKKIFQNSTFCVFLYLHYRHVPGSKSKNRIYGFTLGVMKGIV